MTLDQKTCAVTLVVGSAGAALAALVRIPAGALIGSTVAAIAVAARGWRVGPPTGLRDLAFATVSASLGSGIDDRLPDQLGSWAVSLLFPVVSVLPLVLAFEG